MRRRRWTTTATRGVGYAVAIAFCSVLLTAPPQAMAEQTPQERLDRTEKAGLAARRDALARDMRANPSDIAIALEHARVAAALEDFEGAITSLERLLTLGPVDPRVEARLRLEIGALYFKLGANTVAERSFARAAATGALTSAEQDRVARFQEAIEDRGARHRFDGFVDIGVVATDNANLGTDADTVAPFGVLTDVDPSAAPRGDVGGRARAGLTHRYDLGRPNDDHWRTDLAGVALEYIDVDEARSEIASLRTGPVLSLDDARYGLKIRPFVQGSVLGVDGALARLEGGGGVRLSQAVSDRWHLSATALGLTRQVVDGPRDDERDAALARLRLGATFRPGRTLRLRAELEGERSDAEIAGLSYVEIGGRLSLAWSYGRGPDVFATERPWRLEAFGASAWRRFDTADVAVDETERRDVELQLGVAHTAYLTDDVAVEVNLRHSRRFSEVDLFDFGATRIGAALRLEF